MDSRLVGESKNGRLSYQQQMVWDRMLNGLNCISSANDHMASKASVILGGAAASFATTAAFLSGSQLGLPHCLAALAGLVAIVMTLIAGSVWTPNDVFVPGTGDVDDLFETYIAADVDSAYNLALDDMAGVYSKEKERNSRIAVRVTAMVICLDLMILLLIAVIVTSTSANVGSGVTDSASSPAPSVSQNPLVDTPSDTQTQPSEP